MAVDIRLEILADIVARHPGWTPRLRDLGIDVEGCSAMTLAAAADAADASVDDIVAALWGPDRSTTECTSIRDAPTRQLVGHLVGVHHDFMHRELPRISETIHSLRQADPDDERCRNIESIFTDLREELEPHLASEEAVLFPLCIEIADAFSSPSFHTGPVDRPIERLLHDHLQADSILDDLVAGTSAAWPDGPDDDDSDAVATLLDAVAALEVDLRLHLSEEEELLFPMVRRLAEELDQT